MLLIDTLPFSGIQTLRNLLNLSTKESNEIIIDLKQSQKKFYPWGISLVTIYKQIQ